MSLAPIHGAPHQKHRSGEAGIACGACKLPTLSPSSKPAPERSVGQEMAQAMGQGLQGAAGMVAMLLNPLGTAINAGNQLGRPTNSSFESAKLPQAKPNEAWGGERERQQQLIRLAFQQSGAQQLTARLATAAKPAEVKAEPKAALESRSGSKV